MEVDVLNQLDKEVMACRNCGLCDKKHNKPEWTSDSKYALVFESPNRLDIDKFWEIWDGCGIKSISRKDFLIIHSVQCLPATTKRSGRLNVTKPSMIHRKECKKWITKYIKHIKPKKAIVFGNLGLEMVTGQFDGILKLNSSLIPWRISGRVIPTIVAVNPSCTLYKKNGSTNLTETCIQSFMES